MLKLRSFLAIATLIFLSVPICLLAPDGSDRQGNVVSDFISAADGRLFLGGAEYTQIGLNAYHLFRLYYDNGSAAPAGTGRELGKKILRDIGGHGFQIIRVDATMFFPVPTEDTFFDPDRQTQAAKREKYFAAFQAMLDDCKENGVRIIPSLMWRLENIADFGRHSLHEAVTDRRSKGYLRFMEYASAIVKRYRDETAVAFWEIGNEYNLLADQQKPGGVIGDLPYPDRISPDVYRGDLNNFNSGELADFYRDVIRSLKEVDPNHLIGTGDAEPRPAAMHLYSAAAAGRPPDWAQDSPGDLEKYLRMITKGPDLVSIHHYPVSKNEFRKYADTAAKIGKPVYIGEFGPAFTSKGLEAGTDSYTLPKHVENFRVILNDLLDSKVPIGLAWAYASPETDKFSLWYGRTDPALKLLEDANLALTKRRKK